jgi:hypothetical protein
LGRWCFSERAAAEAFKKQFGGNYAVKIHKRSVKRTMPSIIATTFISNPIDLISSGCDLAAQLGLI